MRQYNFIDVFILLKDKENMQLSLKIKNLHLYTIIRLKSTNQKLKNYIKH